jgi:hypothetical protein
MTLATLSQPLASRFPRWLFGRPQDLEKKFRRTGLQLDELQAHVEPRGSAVRKALDPHHLSRISRRRHVREEELHLEKLADPRLVVAVDPNAAEADIDGLTLAGEKLHAGRAAVQRNPDPPVLSPIFRRQVFGGHHV